MDKYRNGNQGFQLIVSDNAVVFIAYCVKCFRCFKRRERCEQRFRMSIRIGGADIVLHILRFSHHRVIHVTVQNLMELQNIVLRERDCVETLMNDIQYIPVSGNFLFVAVFRCCLFLYQLTDTGACCDNTFDRIGCFGALHLCNLYQFFEFLRFLLQIQLLFSRFFVDGGNQRKNIRIPFLLSDF